MSVNSQAEVHFYNAHEAAVFIDIPPDSNFQEFYEILLFCCFSREQLIRAGRKTPILATTLALLLVNIRGSLSCLASYQTPYHPTVSAYRGYPGTVQFVGQLTYTPENCRFSLSARGFSLFRRHQEYYETHASIVLLRHLAQERIDDTEYVEALSRACSDVGMHYLRGEFVDSSRENRATKIALRAGGRMLMERSRAVI